MIILRNFLIVILLALVAYLAINPPQPKPNTYAGPDFIPSDTKHLPACPECKKYQLKNWWDSPAVYGGSNSLYPGHREGDRWKFDRGMRNDDQFSRVPLVVEGQE